MMTMNSDARLCLLSRKRAWRSDPEHSSHCGPESPRDYLRFGRGEYKGWREQYVIAADTIDTSLRRIGEDIFGEHCLTDFFGDIVFAREGLTRRFVFYE